jgi:hypothetical protein
MPRQVSTTVYTFAELTAQAQAKVRDRLRETEAQHWSGDDTIEDCRPTLETIGIAFNQLPTRTAGGKPTTRTEPDIAWSGFSSQGDGASFAGFYKYNPAALDAIRADRPTDDTLIGIVEDIEQLQRSNQGQITARLTRNNRQYCHPFTIDVDVIDERIEQDPPDATIDRLRRNLRGLMDWLYRQLEADYDYAQSDEAINELIEANDWPFTADGKHFTAK